MPPLRVQSCTSRGARATSQGSVRELIYALFIDSLAHLPGRNPISRPFRDDPSRIRSSRYITHGGNQGQERRPLHEGHVHRPRSWIASEEPAHLARRPAHQCGTDPSLLGTLTEIRARERLSCGVQSRALEGLRWRSRSGVSATNAEGIHTANTLI